MRTIITGCADMENLKVVQRAIEDSCFSIDEVVSGTGRGVDRLGEEWARQQGVRVKKVPPERQKYGASAAAERNRELMRRADALIVVWDGHNRDTLKLINQARARGLKVHVHRVH